jgi:hypothetical protein
LPLDHIDLSLDFDLYVVAETTDPGRMPWDKYYTSCARASWQFSWNSGVNETSPYACSQPVDAAVTPPQGFAATDGSEPPRSHDIVGFANDIIKQHKFTE